MLGARWAGANPPLDSPLGHAYGLFDIDEYEKLIAQHRQWRASNFDAHRFVAKAQIRRYDVLFEKSFLALVFFELIFGFPNGPHRTCKPLGIVKAPAN